MANNLLLKGFNFTNYVNILDIIIVLYNVQINMNKGVYAWQEK